MSSIRSTRWMIALASFLGTLVLAEAALRVLAWRANRADFRQALTRKFEAVPGTRLELKDILRLSLDERIIYEFIPDLREANIRHLDMLVSTNRHGFRSPEIEPEKPPGTVRIVGLGDSVMFGWKVPQGANFLALLGEGLAREFPQRRWEIVNTAVPGYNPVMEVETLRTKALAFEPDLVVLCFVGNDTNLPNFVYQERGVLDFSTSFLVEELQVRFGSRKHSADMESAPAHLVNVKEKPTADGSPDLDLEHVPAPYRALVGWKPFEDALDELARLSREHGFEVVALTFRSGPTTHRMLDEAAERGFRTVPIVPAQQEWLTEHGIKNYNTSPLVISPEDPHPSAIGHEIGARVLLRYLVDEGVAERLAR